MTALGLTLLLLACDRGEGSDDAPGLERAQPEPPTLEAPREAIAGLRQELRRRLEAAATWVESGREAVGGEDEALDALEHRVREALDDLDRADGLDDLVDVERDVRDLEDDIRARSGA